MYQQFDRKVRSAARDQLFSFGVTDVLRDLLFGVVEPQSAYREWDGARRGKAGSDNRPSPTRHATRQAQASRPTARDALSACICERDDRANKVDFAAT